MSRSERDAPIIFVLAGVNGAGKSSIGGARLREAGLNYFNPDEVAWRIRERTSRGVEEANALAWSEGKRRLESAIETRASYAFESTLGGNTIPSLLREAAIAGIDVVVWFIGLSSAEQHIARVRARVAAGGHDIPEVTIRQRWDAARRNIIVLLPDLAELKLFDNSKEGSATAGTIPPPRLLLHWRQGRVIGPAVAVLQASAEWAKPIVAAALKLQRTT